MHRAHTFPASREALPPRQWYQRQRLVQRRSVVTMPLVIEYCGLTIDGGFMESRLTQTITTTITTTITITMVKAMAMVMILMVMVMVMMVMTMVVTAMAMAMVMAAVVVAIVTATVMSMAMMFFVARRPTPHE